MQAHHVPQVSQLPSQGARARDDREGREFHVKLGNHMALVFVQLAVHERLCYEYTICQHLPQRPRWESVTGAGHNNPVEICLGHSEGMVSLVDTG